MHQFLVLEIKKWTLDDIITYLEICYKNNSVPLFNSLGRKPGLIEELAQRLFEINGYEYEESDPVAIALRRVDQNILIMYIRNGNFEKWVKTLFDIKKKSKESIFKAVKKATLA